MEKIVVKTAVKTVLIILGVFIAVFAVFNFAFPQHMATATESLGNYDLAVKYASLRYYYTKSCDDLARCFDDSVLLGRDEYILQYGEPLVNHKDYAAVCGRKDAQQKGSRYNYDHWVKGKLSVSYYNIGKKANDQKKIDKAIDVAFKDNGTDSFVYGNALMLLSARVVSEKDYDTAKELSEKVLDKIKPTDSKENGYLTQIKAALNGVKPSATNQG